MIMAELSFFDNWALGCAALGSIYLAYSLGIEKILGFLLAVIAMAVLCVFLPVGVGLILQAIWGLNTKKKR